MTARPLRAAPGTYRVQVHIEQPGAQRQPRLPAMPGVGAAAAEPLLSVCVIARPLRAGLGTYRVRVHIEQPGAQR